MPLPSPEPKTSVTTWPLNKSAPNQVVCVCERSSRSRSPERPSLAPGSSTHATRCSTSWATLGAGTGSVPGRRVDNARCFCRLRGNRKGKRCSKQPKPGRSLRNTRRVCLEGLHLKAPGLLYKAPTGHKTPGRVERCGSWNNCQEVAFDMHGILPFWLALGRIVALAACRGCSRESRSRNGRAHPHRPATPENNSGAEIEATRTAPHEKMKP